MNIFSTKHTLIIAIFLQFFVSSNVMSSTLTIDVTQMAQELSSIKLEYSHFDTNSNSTEFDQNNSSFNLIYYWGDNNQVAFGPDSTFRAVTGTAGLEAYHYMFGSNPMNSNVTGQHTVTSRGEVLSFFANHGYATDNGAFSLDFDIAGEQYQFISSNQTHTEISFVPGQVSAVPVPAAVWLMGSALLGLVGVSRRKQLS